MIIPIVDEQDNFLCYKDSKERDPNKEVTRSSALWVVNEKGEILIVFGERGTSTVEAWGVRRVAY